MWTKQKQSTYNLQFAFMLLYFSITDRKMCERILWALQETYVIPTSPTSDLDSTGLLSSFPDLCQYALLGDSCPSVIFWRCSGMFVESGGTHTAFLT
jgi:hypothetical protein